MYNSELEKIKWELENNKVTLEEAIQQSYNKGCKFGYQKGYDAGYDVGYEDGMNYHNYK